MNIQEPLTWNSGDTIVFDRENERVTKFSYDKRLLIQKARQEEMSDLFNNNQELGFSKVIDWWQRDGKFFFEMEYIKWTLWSSLMMSWADELVTKFAEKVFFVLNTFWWLQNISENRPTQWEWFYDLLMSKVIGNTRKLSELSRIKNEQEILTCFDMYLSNIDEAIEHSTTPYLGDCTFDNMIIQGDLSVNNTSNGDLLQENKIIFFDLLDLQYPHFRQDIAKLHQDIDASFSAIKYNKVIWIEKKRLFKETFWAKLRTHYPQYEKYHYPLVAYSLMRILPYLHDKTQYDKIYADMMNCLRKWHENYI